MEVHKSDLEKIFDVVEAAYRFHSSWDAMNGAVHLAQQTRLSPLTSELSAALDRLKAMIES
jgi:hypothetical protein